MVIKIPSDTTKTSKADKALKSTLGLKEKAGARPSDESHASRKPRAQVYGITYRQIEQYIIARYGSCQNGRLMGALAAAVRAGRLTRDGKLYMPSGSMLSPQALLELEKRSFEEQQAEKLRLKRDRKTARQAT